VSCAQRWSRAGCAWSSITGRLFAVGTPRLFVAQPRAMESGEDQATRPSVHQNSEEIGSTHRFIVRPGRLKGSRPTQLDDLTGAPTGYPDSGEMTKDKANARAS